MSSLALLPLAALLLSFPRPAAALDGCNPAIDRVGLADPFVLEHEGTYYLYPTVDGVEGYQVWTSTDTKTWTEGPVVFEAGPDAWAPEVYYEEATGTFYLHYSVDFRIGVATASSPLGPFVDRGILVDDAIDAHLFEDDDGRLYLYYEEIRFTGGFPTTSRIWVQPMATPATPSGPPTLLFGPTDPWEFFLFGQLAITEGPFMFKYGGVYYLMYSGSGAPFPNYAIGYATSDSPTGPFTKHPGNPIASFADGVSGPGHHSLFRAPNGQTLVAYHQKLTNGFGFDRYIAIDPLIVRPDGILDIEPRPLTFASGTDCDVPYEKRGDWGLLHVASPGRRGFGSRLLLVVAGIDGLRPEDLGDPTRHTSYSVYVEGLGVTTLPPSDRFEVKENARGTELVYRDRRGSAGGIRLLRLRLGADGRATLVVRGGGRRLELSGPLGLAVPREVAVCNALGVCIAGTMDRTLSSTATRFLAVQSRPAPLTSRASKHEVSATNGPGADLRPRLSGAPRRRHREEAHDGP